MKPTIEIWADVRCPWCWLGHRRVQAAFDRVGRERFDVRHRSYLLEPGGPEGTRTTVREAALGSWGMSEQEWARSVTRIETAAATEDLPVRIETARTIDSRPAHRLLKAATANGIDPWTSWEAFFAAHLQHNADLEDPDVLVATATGIGLDADEARAVATSTTFLDEVHADHEEGRRRGVRAVPTLAHGDVVLGGAHDVGELVSLLRGALEQAA